MAGITPNWVRILAILALICGVIGIIAGAWLFAPILIVGLLLLVIPMRGTPPPSA
jgi:hypothetical protein